jgi:hypothetical protein
MKSMKNTLQFFIIFLVMLAQACSYGEGYPTYDELEFVHAIAPLDTQHQITFIEYPEASKKFYYDTAGAQKLLVSAYANAFVIIGTKTDTFQLLLKPIAAYVDEPNSILYQGYQVMEENFNSFYKTSIYTKNKYQFSSYNKYKLDTLYFK